MAASYDYLSLRLARRATPHADLSETIKAGVGALAQAGGEVVGQFAPQLGWANDEAAVLVRWRNQPGGLDWLKEAEVVAGVESRRLQPTVRPSDEDAPGTGGIYVHRWFEVDVGSLEEFVELSREGWRDFEPRFEASVFGLFREAAASQDVARLLLLTRYADHGVWEASRDPSTAAMRIFARRQQLTRRTWAASTWIVPIA